jgi:hypothetical protein
MGGKQTVYILWYEEEREDFDDIELLIGVYASPADAEAAIGRLKGEKGFAQHPENFHFYPYVIGEDHWADGFVEDPA